MTRLTYLLCLLTLWGGPVCAAPQQSASAVRTVVVTHAITVQWGSSPTSGVTYNVYRSTSSTSNGSIISGHLNALFYTERPGVNGAVSGTTYFYRVTAVDASNVESAFAQASSGLSFVSATMP